MKAWLGVASRDHVRMGIAGGFAQLCHGKARPLARMNEGDWIAYYSAKLAFRGAEPHRAFTAIGQVVGSHVYPFEMAPGFVPFRRDIRFARSVEAPIAPLLSELHFARGNYGMKLRSGHFEIDAHDLALIARAMGVTIPGARAA